ncbi:MAG: multicopper oxidase domain-containing protein [Hyphomonadaceae bacterium]|jgi:FtsP/CotA-like multicopper oxidase with cupredoxin domain|nr:multicopper oxidase domain-containing protein [Hyphomonadaceae bacterium]
MVTTRDPVAFDQFGCNVIKENPATPDRLPPDISFDRQGATGVDLVMPDGKTVQFWTFRDKNDKNNETARQWPAKTIRVRQGQLVHSTIHAQKNSHTIHHHGMNASTHNDGVGHVSFEVNGKYTYQFRPQNAGTYFYHCHKNTVLHFEMGMYGFLIVDPPTGKGRLYEGGPAYDVEALWAFDDVDPEWRKLEHQAGLCGNDVGLNVFVPKYFMCSGVPNPLTRTDPRVVVNAKVGQRILVRHLNASYSLTSTRFSGLDATIYAVDGRPLSHPDHPWSTPIQLAAGSPLETCTGQRRDIIIVPTRPGIYPVITEFRDWQTGFVQDGGRGIVETFINVTA